MRLHARLAELALLGATPDGIDRALFTPAENAARRRFAGWAQAADLRVEQDCVGNVFVRLNGSDESLAPVQCGSHLDTVKHGGAYDGALGVIGGLEVLERIAAGRRPRRSLEVVAWAGEEGSRFPLGCLGSSAFAQITPYADVCALVGDDGTAFSDALTGRSGLLDDIAMREGFPPPAAYIELHIEQGPILERRGTRLGVVTAIAGQRRLSVRIDGEAGHAGTVPMAGRADALCAASELTLAVERAAGEVGDAVATVGRLLVEPNQTNTVPGRVDLRIDARAIDDERVAEIERRTRRAAAEIARRRSTPIQIDLTEYRAAAAMDERMRTLVRAACQALDPDCVDIPSGAGHDAMCLARIVPTAMIFVPSIGGCSHVASERTAPADLERGVLALEASLLAVDREFV